jgi:hypothetical protein
MDMGRLDDYVADSYWIELHGPCKTAFNDSVAKRIREQQQSFLYAERTEDNAAMGMKFHMF